MGRPFKHGRTHGRRGSDRIPGLFEPKQFLYHIKWADDELLVAGDGLLTFRPASIFDRWSIISADGSVTTPSSSGDITVQLYMVDQTYGFSGDLFTTPIVIPDGDTNKWSGIIDTTTPGGGAAGPRNTLVDTFEYVRVDVDGAGTGAAGLEVRMLLEEPA